MLKCDFLSARKREMANEGQIWDDQGVYKSLLKLFYGLLFLNSVLALDITEKLYNGLDSDSSKSITYLEYCLTQASIQNLAANRAVSSDFSLAALPNSSQKELKKKTDLNQRSVKSDLAYSISYLLESSGLRFRSLDRSGPVGLSPPTSA